MPMVRTPAKNKRVSARKVPERTKAKKNRPDTSPFPEYIEQNDGLYRCLLCKGYTLERYMWLNRSGMYQHEKRGTRHKRSVKVWLAARAKGLQLDTNEDDEGVEYEEVEEVEEVEEDEEDEDSNLDELESSEPDKERSECEDTIEIEEPELEPETEPELELELDPEPEPVAEEPKTPTLYYPTTSWDEPVNQGIRVAFDNSQSTDCEPAAEERPAVPEVKKKVAKWDGSSQGCVYGSTKTNGYYTCIWCNLPDMPQRKYRRCKRAIKALQEKVRLSRVKRGDCFRATEANAVPNQKPTHPVENSPELEDVDPPPYQLLYPSY